MPGTVQEGYAGGMAVTLNQRAYDHARRLVAEGAVVDDDRDAWSEHRPSPQQENAFIAEHGYGEYGRWHLGVDDEHGAETKAHYKFPYGDFVRVHRCGLLAAESRAGQRGYTDIELAVAHLHGMVEERRALKEPRTAE
ncbi:MAG: hypothetical protein QOG20_6021 [Pseudonocardiales bacterium]|nr:hypothetical protein [Pseudonocardia sp.]MDT7613432.1 hypothetical protein [Pseudonocardiales bacterium]MDT7710414.1 hypothetical protein [Pseudonocardiales bacterium]